MAAVAALRNRLDAYPTELAGCADEHADSRVLGAGDDRDAGRGGHGCESGGRVGDGVPGNAPAAPAQGGCFPPPGGCRLRMSR